MLTFVVTVHSTKEVESPGLPSLKLLQPTSYVLKSSRIPSIRDCIGFAKHNLKLKDVIFTGLVKMESSEVNTIPLKATDYLGMPIVLGS